MSAGRRRRKRHQLDIVYNVDASDPIGNWYHAKIVGRRGERLKIHYVGWNSRHDAWLPTDRIAPYGTKTGYKGTIGPKERTWDRRVKLDLLMERLDRIQQQTAAELKALRGDMSSREESEEDSGSSPSPQKDEDSQAELEADSGSLKNEESNGEESASVAYSVDEFPSQGSRARRDSENDRVLYETSVEPVDADPGNARDEGSSLVNPFGGEPMSEEDSDCEVDILKEDDEEDKAKEKAKLFGTMKPSSGVLDRLVASVEKEKADVVEQTVGDHLGRMVNSSVDMSKARVSKLLRNPQHSSDSTSSGIRQHRGELILSADSRSGSIRPTDDERESDADVVNRSRYKEEEIDDFYGDFVEESNICRIVWDVHQSPAPSKEVDPEGGEESSAKFVDVVQQPPRTGPNDSTVAGRSSRSATSAENLREKVALASTKKERAGIATASLAVMSRGDIRDVPRDVPKDAPLVESEVLPTSATRNEAEQRKRVSHAQSSVSNSIAAISRTNLEPKDSVGQCQRQSPLLLEDEERGTKSISSSADPERKNGVRAPKGGRENPEAGHSADITASRHAEYATDVRRSTPQNSSRSESSWSSANELTPVLNNAPTLKRATPPVRETNIFAKEDRSVSAQRKTKRPSSSKLVRGSPESSSTVLTKRKAAGVNSVVRKPNCFLVCQDARGDISRKWKNLKELDSASLFQMLREKVSVDEGSIQNSESEESNCSNVSAKTNGTDNSSVAGSAERTVDQVACTEGELLTEAREKSPKKEEIQDENSPERHDNEGREVEERAHNDENIEALCSTDLQRERANETKKGELAPKNEDGSVKVAADGAMGKGALVSMIESIIHRETCNIFELTINSIAKPPNVSGGSCNGQPACLTKADLLMVPSAIKPEKNSQGPYADDSSTRIGLSTVRLGVTNDKSNSVGREPILKVGCSQREMNSAGGRSKDKFLRKTSSSPLRAVEGRGRGMSMESARSQRIGNSSSGRVNEGKTHANDSTDGTARRNVLNSTPGRPSPVRAIRTSCRRRTATSKEFYSEVTPSPRKRARRNKADLDAKEDPASPQRIKAKPPQQQPEPASVSEVEVREFLLRREDGSRFAAFVPPVWALLKGLNELTDLTYGGRRAALRKKAKESEEKRRQELERAKRILATSRDW